MSEFNFLKDKDTLIYLIPSYLVSSYTFENNNSKIKVEFSFGYTKVNGLVKINLHHSSIPFQG